MNLTRGINLRKIAELMPGASGAEVKVGFQTVDTLFVTYSMTIVHEYITHHPIKLHHITWCMYFSAEYVRDEFRERGYSSTLFRPRSTVLCWRAIERKNNSWRLNCTPRPRTFCNVHLGSVVQRPDSAIHWIAIFSTFDRYNLRLRFGIYKLKFLRSIVGSRCVVSQLFG